MEERVTVVIPAYNPGRYLTRAITSIIQQTIAAWSIVIVDDGSTDSGIQRALETINDPRIKVVRLDTNVGQSQALNMGLRHVNTEYMVQLDADDWLPRHALETLINEADNQPEDVAVVSGNCVIVTERNRGRLVRTEVLLRRPFSDRYDFLLSNMSLYPRFYRTEALRRVGGWPLDGPYRGRYLEDLRILLRLIEHYRFHWVNDRLYYYRRHGKNQTNRKRRLGRVLRWTIRDALKRWGGYWTPVFATSKGGWVKVVGLKPRKLASKPIVRATGKTRVTHSVSSRIRQRSSRAAASGRRHR